MLEVQFGLLKRLTTVQLALKSVEGNLTQERRAHLTNSKMLFLLF